MKYTYQTPVSGFIKHPLPKGTTIISVNGESDSDDQGNTRSTGSMAAGEVTRCNQHGNDDVWHYSVDFPNGTSVWIDSEELATQPYVVIVAESDIPPPPVSARDLHALATRMLAEINGTESKGWDDARIPTGDDFNDLCDHIARAAHFGVDAMRRRHDALAALIDVAEDIQSNSSYAQTDHEREVVANARTLLAELKGFL